MIIFDIRLGRFSLLVQREAVQPCFKVTREGPGEVRLGLPYLSILFSNEKTAYEALLASRS